MPMNSGKDFKAREVDVAQPLMAGGPVGGNQGGDYIVQPIAFRVAGDGAAYEEGGVTAPLTTGTDPSAAIIAFSCKDHGADAGPVSPTLRSMGHSNSHANAGGQVAVAFSLRGRQGGAQAEVEDGDLAPALRAAEGGSTRPFVAFDETQITSKANRSNPRPGDPCHPLAAGARPPTPANEMAVRRITVVEACRLQGFDDLYTLIEWPTANRKGDELAEQIAYLVGHGLDPERAAVLAQTPDGPQYKAIGNSKAVPLVRMIGRRYLAALKRHRAQRDAA
jgi:DNA (cytosine-5)-methyltransferase 1